MASLQLNRYIADWSITVVLFFSFVFLENLQPFAREFSYTDLTISHPYTQNEQFSIGAVFGIVVLLPTAIFAARVFLIKSTSKNFADKLNLLQVSILGLCFAITLNGVVTDLLKNWISRPRPDFLARCGGLKTSIGSQAGNKLYTIDICSAPYGRDVLIEGLRSTPSGHTSTSFAGLLYLSFWLIGQMKILSRKTPFYKFLICFIPIMVGIYIGLTRTQDYRHHFSDVSLGALIGSLIATFSYFKLFPPLTSGESDLLPEERVLPL